MDIVNGICHEGGGGSLVLHIVWALYYIQIVVEPTKNMAEYTSSRQSAARAGEECQLLEDLRIISLTWTRCNIRYISRFNCKRKKVG